MPRYARGSGRVTVACVPEDALVQRRWFCVELSLFSEAWELGRLPEEGAGWYFSRLVCYLTQHLEALKPSWSGLARCLL